MKDIVGKKWVEIVEVKVDVEMVLNLREEKDWVVVEIVWFCNDLVDVEIDVDNLMMKF